MNKLHLALFMVAACATSSCHGQAAAGVWTYQCVNGLCERALMAEGAVAIPSNVCKLNCDVNGSLLPLPTGTTTIGKSLTGFYKERLTFTGFSSYPAATRALFEGATAIFKDRLKNITNRLPIYDANSVVVTLSATQSSVAIATLDTDESYNLTVTWNAATNTASVSIMGVTFFGARHGLETLSQLIEYDEYSDVLQLVNAVSILNDKPAYKYRGVMLDTSRNFISVQGIKRFIDGLSHNKLNMFHWHITDTHSFPMTIAGNLNFTRFGAYSPTKVYTLPEMTELVSYARVRGVKIVPELDEPAHTGYGWQWGPAANLGELVVCLNKQPWYDFCVEPPCGQLNIVNEAMYDVLGTVYASMLGIFDTDLFHMGGDEVDLRCYNTTQEIVNWMGQNGYDRDVEGFVRLWGRFQDKAHAKLREISPTVQSILWTSELTAAEHIQQYLPQDDYIIQIWTETDSAMIPDLLNAGYRTIFSNYDALYLDCGFQAWIGNGHNWCSPYKGWQTVYENDPISIYAAATNESIADEAYARGLILGAAAPLWTEQADESSFESRIFPRVSALAERLWTNPRERGAWLSAEYRMVANRARLVERGIAADRLQPEFCSQYQENCYGWGAAPPAPEPEVPSPSPSPATTTTTTTTRASADNVNDDSGATSTKTWTLSLLLILIPLITN